ncbi:MAG: methyltransferase domain-containing protein [Bacteroidetes bacterium]|nr:methyltransferase domain-containing protein [Bacteroidota bacterium]
MKYSETLKELFAGITLNAEDLLLLEAFQIKYLPARVPKKEFSALLRANPVIHRYLISKYTPIEDFISTILKENKPINNKSTIEKYCQELLWEIADLIVYNKYPEIYDAKVEFAWDFREITSVISLEGKVVIDAGAGTGKLAFQAAQIAVTVFAIEPVTSLRRFIRDKANKENVKNLYAMDGFLDSIPLPDNSADVLMTSNAIGWNLEDELKEIERVLKPNACAIHLLRNSDPKAENPLHNILISPDWKYTCTQYNDNNGLKIKYYKIRT